MGWALGSEGSLPQLQTPLLPPHQLKPQHQVGQSVLRDQGVGRELGPLGSGETEAPGAPPRRSEDRSGKNSNPHHDFV